MRERVLLKTDEMISVPLKKGVSTSCPNCHSDRIEDLIESTFECKIGECEFPTPTEQKNVVEPAMTDAVAKGFDEESVADALGIESEEIRRILRGEGVSEPAVWEVIKRHLRMDE